MTKEDLSLQRWSGVDVDTDAIESNMRHLVELCAPSSVWAVVKANGYGHGAITVSRAAVAGGASGLAVALVQEAAELRNAGIESRILALSDQPHDQYGMLLAANAEVMVYRSKSIDALGSVAQQRGVIARVHLKVDTGMRRVGAEPSSAGALIARIQQHPNLQLVGVATHFATADIPGHPGIAQQSDEFALMTSLVEPETEIHMANSAAALLVPESRYSYVRAGIALYGIDPSTEVKLDRDVFSAALRWWARVSYVKVVEAGEHVSYGWRYQTTQRTRLGTIPVGYADGVPRRWSEVGGVVLIGGRRRPVVGVVTMDQLVVDLGPEDESDPIDIGDEVVLIGRQGNEHMTVEEWAERLGTIGYEIVCQISGRVPRRAVGLPAERS
ncbi:MAG TPA: alanine racemase [Acidimicrobiaceae bacterium]|nr:alanine racemase [Acidimicrobiaceae bacterium]